MEVVKCCSPSFQRSRIPKLIDLPQVMTPEQEKIVNDVIKPGLTQKFLEFLKQKSAGIFIKREPKVKDRMSLMLAIADEKVVKYPVRKVLRVEPQDAARKIEQFTNETFDLLA